MQAELFLAVETAEAGGGLVVEQAGGGHQLAAVQIAHADVAAVRVVVIHVQAQLGAFQLGIEFAAEHGVAQGLGLAQRIRADQALGVQAAFGSSGDLGHRLASVSQPAMGCGRSMLLGKLRLGTAGVTSMNNW